jgi:hypothetical protein
MTPELVINLTKSQANGRPIRDITLINGLATITYPAGQELLALSKSQLDKFKKVELVEFAEYLGLEVPAEANKAEIVEVLHVATLGNAPF